MGNDGDTGDLWAASSTSNDGNTADLWTASSTSSVWNRLWGASNDDASNGDASNDDPTTMGGLMDSGNDAGHEYDGLVIHEKGCEGRSETLLRRLKGIFRRKLGNCGNCVLCSPTKVGSWKDQNKHLVPPKKPRVWKPPRQDVKQT